MWLNTECAKEARCDAHAFHELRATCGAKQETLTCIDVERAEDRVSRLQIEEVTVGEVVARNGGTRACGIYQFMGVHVWERLQVNGIHEGED